jgi:serine/threonine-protein kinase
MGLLYRGTDLTLGRAVAVKLLARHLVLDQTAKTRFIQEARTASALDHPNIANIHDIGEVDGELFIVMALYDGETLQQRLEKGPLPVDETVEILRQLALGLEAAHRAGIVHRDIKPANTLKTSSGTVKILDFGIAKLLGESQGQMTQPGQAVGTVLYMSPEQLRGEPADARSDLWSVGVLAYELLSGVSPFQTDSSATAIARVLQEEPVSLATVPGVPDGLVQLVLQLLRKNPAERPQSARELLNRLVPSALSHARPAQTASPSHPGDSSETQVAFPSRGMSRVVAPLLMGAILLLGAAGLYLYLRREGRNPEKAFKSLAVLPFVNASANAEMEYLSDGIAETLIDNLSQIPELKVIARDTAFGYKDKGIDLQKLGRELSVDTVLTGRVQQRGDTLVIHANLVNVVDRSQLWGEKYNRKLTDVLSVEEEIAKAISEKLRPRLSSMVARRMTKRSTDNPEAYQLYLRGRYFWNMRTKESLSKSIEQFEQAIGIDPNYALAHAGVADSYESLAYYAFVPREEYVAKAEAAALKALAIDDELAEAHATLGFIRLTKWDWLTAEKQLKRSIELNPNYAQAHGSYGSYLSLMAQSNQAVAEFVRAQQLDPASAVYAGNLGVEFCQMGQYDKGIAQLKDAQQLTGNRAFQHFVLATTCYSPRKMYQEAIDELEKALAINPTDPRFSGQLANVYAQSGNKDRALTILEQLKERDRSEDAATAIATAYIGLDDKERAFEWLEKAYQRRSLALGRLKISKTFDPLRSDPRFEDLVRRVGFPR